MTERLDPANNDRTLHEMFDQYEAITFGDILRRMQSSKATLDELMFGYNLLLEDPEFVSKYPATVAKAKQFVDRLTPALSEGKAGLTLAEFIGGKAVTASTRMPVPPVGARSLIQTGPVLSPDDFTVTGQEIVEANGGISFEKEAFRKISRIKELFGNDQRGVEAWHRFRVLVMGMNNYRGFGVDPLHWVETVFVPRFFPDLRGQARMEKIEELVRLFDGLAPQDFILFNEKKKD